MKVHYNKKIGLTFLIFSGIIFIFSLLSSTLSLGTLSSVIVGIAIGIAMMKKIFFVVEDKKITMNAFFGPSKKIHELNANQNFIIEDSKLYMKNNDGTKKLIVSRLWVDKKDWDDLIKIIYQNS